jgi:hypothetical protein
MNNGYEKQWFEYIIVVELHQRRLSSNAKYYTIN